MSKVVFIMDYMDKLLKEIGYPVSLIIESSKKTDADTDSILKGLRERIGYYDFNQLKLVNQRLLQLLVGNNEIFSNVFNADNEIPYLSYGAEEEKTLQSILAVDNPVLFEETYSIEVTTEGDFIITVKEGFMNYIGLNGTKKYNKVLLGEIINFIPKRNLFSNESKLLTKTYKKLLSL